MRGEEGEVASIEREREREWGRCYETRQVSMVLHFEFRDRTAAAKSDQLFGGLMKLPSKLLASAT